MRFTKIFLIIVALISGGSHSVSKRENRFNNSSTMIIYIDKSEVIQDKIQQLKKAYGELVKFVKENEPDIISYGVYFNETETEVIVTHIHKTPATLDFHMKVAGPEFAKFADLLRLKSIEVYGKPSKEAVIALKKKAEMLGGATLQINQLESGFNKLLPQSE